MQQKDTNPIFIIHLIRKGTSQVKYLLSKWWVILLVSLLIGSLGVLYTWLQKPAYVAELVFSSEAGGENNLGGYAGLAAQFGFDLGGGKGGAFEGDNLIELLRTWHIVEQTLLSDAPHFGNNKLMIDAYIANHEMDKGWNKNPKMRGLKFEKNQSPNRIRDSIMKAVYKDITEGQLNIDKKDKKLNYLVVKMKDVNEQFSKDFVETLVGNAAKYYVAYKSLKARKNFELVNRLTDSVRRLLYGNIESLASSSDLNVNPLRQSVRTTGQKIQANSQVNAALYTELVKQLGLAQLTLQKETPLIQIIDEPVLPLKNEKGGRLKAGVIFAFAGGLLFCAFLVVYRWLKGELKGD